MRGFKKGSTGRDNAEIILDVLKEKGPMTVRDITKVVSGYEVGDTQYSGYASTVTGILYSLLKRGHVGHDKSGERTIYMFEKALERSAPVHIPSEGMHIVHDLTVSVKDGKVEKVMTKDGKPVSIYIPAEITGRGIRTILEMPISMDRLRRGLRTGRIAVEVHG